MKKILFPVIVLILTACVSSNSPEVTVTSEAIVTLPPPTATIIPTPTLNPQFVILQEQIANSGNRFALLPDGTIQETTSEGIKTVQGFSVDMQGQMKLYVEGQEVLLNFADVNFDNKDGITIKGYSYNEQTGEWLKGILIPEYLQNLEFVTSIKDRSDLPNVYIKDVRSGAFSEAIRQSYITGKIQKFAEGTPAFIPVLADENEFADLFGYGPAIVATSRSAYYASVMDTASFVIVDESGKELFFTVPKIFKTGASVDDIGVLIRVLFWTEDFDLTVLKNLVKIPKTKRENYPIKFTNNFGCNSAFAVNDTTPLKGCDEYYQGDYLVLERLIDTWLSDGKFPKELETIPVPVAEQWN